MYKMYDLETKRKIRDARFMLGVSWFFIIMGLAFITIGVLYITELGNGIAGVSYDAIGMAMFGGFMTVKDNYSIKLDALVYEGFHWYDETTKDMRNMIK